MSTPFKHPRLFTYLVTAAPSLYTAIPVTSAWLQKQYWNLSTGQFLIDVEGQSTNDGTLAVETGSYIRTLDLGDVSTDISLVSDGTGLNSYAGSVYGSYLNEAPTSARPVEPRLRVRDQYAIFQAAGDGGGYSVVLFTGLLGTTPHLFVRISCSKAYSAPLRLSFFVQNDYGQSRPTTPYEETVVDFDGVSIPIIVSVSSTIGGFTPELLSQNVSFAGLSYATY
jgi:hypothetical protein